MLPWRTIWNHKDSGIAIGLGNDNFISACGQKKHIEQVILLPQGSICCSSCLQVSLRRTLKPKLLPWAFTAAYCSYMFSDVLQGVSVHSDVIVRGDYNCNRAHFMQNTTPIGDANCG